MAETHEQHEYPGQLHENPGGKIPLFLKLTYLGFTTFAVTYWLLYKAGDGAALVKLFNAATGHAP